MNEPATAPEESTYPDIHDPTADARVVLRSRSLAKQFGSTAALTDCSVEILAGEVHALLGENGSGKSTFAKVITGVHPPDGGSVDLGDGAPIIFRSPAAARMHGIVAVYQEILVAPALTVLENIWLGTDGLFRVKRDGSEKRAVATETLRGLLGRDINLDGRIDTLPLDVQQACCIARALVQDFDLLVLDEATSSLDLGVRSRLFDKIRALAKEGKSVLFVSHRMDEIYEIANRLTVMRSGCTVATIPAAAADEAQLLALLTGKSPDDPTPRSADHRPRPTRLRTHDLLLTPESQPIQDIEIRQGEVTALAGLEGHGQDEFLKALWGSGTATGSVHLLRDGHEKILVKSPHAAKSMGIAYVPRDRREESAFAHLSLMQNFEVATLQADRRLGLLSSRRATARFLHMASALGLHYGKSGDRMATLSGGNQQKIVLARWLALSPTVLLLNDPTRGVDIGTKRDIYRLLVDLAQEGVSVVLLSSEIDEILEVADRVLVFRDKQLAADLRDEQVGREAILGAYFGIRDHQ